MWWVNGLARSDATTNDYGVKLNPCFIRPVGAFRFLKMRLGMVCAFIEARTGRIDAVWSLRSS